MRKELLVFIISILLLTSSCLSDPKKEVPLLITELTAKDSSVRNHACLRLGSFGKEAELAVPHLLKLLRDPNNGVRTSAAFALRGIGGEKAEKALLEYKKED